ncbi:hypothetical protein SL103_26575 [Streptomyces lydicus]|uniref:Uncharacterized protein n=2 Tax=Streptomyces lydicus TaxID=47763 RepID=A0A1D7VRG6_9ACTN|nr:hypothetical protein SL103_26575 [Streptomyces lydicus]
MRRIMRVLSVAAALATAVGYGIDQSGPTAESADSLNPAASGAFYGDSAWGRTMTPYTGPF